MSLISNVEEVKTHRAANDKWKIHLPNALAVKRREHEFDHQPKRGLGLVICC